MAALSRSALRSVSPRALRRYASAALATATHFPAILSTSNIQTMERKRDSIEHGAPETVPSLSASVMVVAPLEKRTSDGFDYKILLLKRHGKSSTFVSAHVFPGGNMDAGDELSKWSHLFPNHAGLSSEEAKMESIKLCAVRETFEEAGILLTECVSTGKGKASWKAMKEVDRKEWRDKVHSNGNSFVDLFKLLKGNDSGSTLRPGLSTLQYRANWITPANMKRRFDTHFFVTILPSSLSLDQSTTEDASSDAAVSSSIGSADGKETTSADWLTPAQAIRLTLAHTKDLTDGEKAERVTTGGLDRIILFPPQFYLLAELAEVKSWKDLLDPKETDVEGVPKVAARPVSAFIPEMRAVTTPAGSLRAATVLPGDPAHSATASMIPLPSPSYRHRTYVIVPEPPKKVEGKEKDGKEGWKAKTPLGLTVLGLHRLGMGEQLGSGWEDMEGGDIGTVKDKAKL